MSKKKNPGLKKVFKLLFRHGGYVHFYGSNAKLSQFSVNIKGGDLNGTYRLPKNFLSKAGKCFHLAMLCSDDKIRKNLIYIAEHNDLLTWLLNPPYVQKAVANYNRLAEENVQNDKVLIFFSVLELKIPEVFKSSLKNGKTKDVVGFKISKILKLLKKRKVEYTVKIRPAEKTKINIKHSSLPKKDTFTIDLSGKSLEDISHKLLMDKIPLS